MRGRLIRREVELPIQKLSLFLLFYLFLIPVTHQLTCWTCSSDSDPFCEGNHDGSSTDCVAPKPPKTPITYLPSQNNNANKTESKTNSTNSDMKNSTNPPDMKNSTNPPDMKNNTNADKNNTTKKNETEEIDDSIMLPPAPPLAEYQCVIIKSVLKYSGNIQISKGCAPNSFVDYNVTVLNPNITQPPRMTRVAIGTCETVELHYENVTTCFCNVDNCNKDEIDGVGREDMMQQSQVDSSGHRETSSFLSLLHPLVLTILILYV